jgi:uncharacterized protein with PQ loop repeat
VLTTTLAFVAICFTVGRTWPQFVRIVLHKDKAGVSLGTWTLALMNHTGWLMYGILSNVPLFIVSNILAGVGCAATVWTLSSWKRAAQITAATAIATAAIYGIGDALLLTVITGFTLSVVLPQLIAVFRKPATGVSTLAWFIAAGSSITWIAWAVSINRLTVVIAHFVLLPAALVIATRAKRAHAHVAIQQERESATAAP